MSSNWYRVDNDNLVLSLTIQPKSSKDEVVGEYNGRCKIRITAPPLDGKANLHLIKYLAKLFQVSKQSVIIEKGKTGKHKQVKIIKATALPPQFET